MERIGKEKKKIWKSNIGHEQIQIIHQSITLDFYFCLAYYPMNFLRFIKKPHLFLAASFGLRPSVPLPASNFSGETSHTSQMWCKICNRKLLSDTWPAIFKVHNQDLHLSPIPGTSSLPSWTYLAAILGLQKSIDITRRHFVDCVQNVTVLVNGLAFLSQTLFIPASPSPLVFFFGGEEGSILLYNRN